MSECVARISHGWGTTQCSKPGKAEREGRWYCGIHDPEKIAARRTKKYAEWDAERRTSLDNHQRAADLLIKIKARTGLDYVGQPYYDGQARGCDGSVVVTAAALSALLELAATSPAPDAGTAASGRAGAGSGSR